MAQTLTQGALFAIQGLWSNAHPVITTWHALVGGNGTRTQQLDEAATRLMNGWFTSICPVLPNNYSFDKCTWVDLSSATGPTGITTRAPATGALSGTSLPPSMGPVVKRVISGSGRAHRSGRLFLPGAVNTTVDEDGKVQGTHKNNVNAGFATFLSTVNTTNPVGNLTFMTLIVAHAPSMEVTRTVTERIPDPNGVMTHSIITDLVCQDLVSGVRRRTKS